MWTELYNPNMKWTQQKLVDIKWQLSSIQRHIKTAGSVKEGIKRWWHLRQVCKKINKSLLRKAKEMENNGINKD